MKKLALSQTHPWFIVLLLRRAFVFICLVTVATLGTSGCSQSPTGGSGGSGGTDASAGGSGGSGGTDAGAGGSGGSGGTDAGATGGTGGAGGAGAPRLFFSDLTSGPERGWEGSATKGAAVSVWGENFGSVRGDSYITINGAQLSTDSYYAEWGVTKNSPRGLERTTFWLNDKAAEGAGNITVTVNGLTSNPLPFTVRSGGIYFIGKDGKDSNNGKYASARAGDNGPWLHFYKANVQKNASLNAGDIVYVRSGTYNDEDEQKFMLLFRGWKGTASNPFAIVGYPGEWPILGQSSPGNGVYTEICCGYGTTDHLEFHKLIWENPGVPVSVEGASLRMVGDIFRYNTADVWSGIVDTDGGWNWKLYGLTFRDTGHDYYKHAIYLRSGSKESTNVDIGWNEFDNYRSDLPTRDGKYGYGSGAVNIRNNSDTLVTHDVYIHDSLFHNMPNAAALYLGESPSNIYFYGNLIYGSGHKGTSSANAMARLGGHNIYVYNNTFYDVGSQGNKMYFVSVNYGNTISKNNIFYSIDNEPAIYIDNSKGSLISDRDLYFGNNLPTGSGTTVTNPITSDPLFVDSSNHDFHLQKKSPAIDAGTSSVGSVVKGDYDGVGRPQPVGGAYDIGAFEYQRK